MKAAFIRSFGDIENVEIGDLPTPDPQENEVQIKVAFAGINPVDWKIVQGHLKNRLPFEFPIILGWDVAGTISKLGTNVKDFKEGDTVFAYCRKEVVHDGSFAEYICLDAKNVAKKPANLTLAEAACIPLSALTAWQSIFDTAHLKAQEAILIHAGAGGVGSFAIQMAKLKGSTVITTGSEKNREYLEKLGADTIIDYVHENFLDTLQTTYPQGIDVVYDTIGGETLEKSYDALKKGGRLVSIIGTPDEKRAKEKRIDAKYVFVSPSGKELKEIATLFEEGKLKTPKIEIFPFADIKKALRQSQTGKTAGKLVLKL